MSSKEQSCMDNCARRFLESTPFVVKVGVAGGGGGAGQRLLVSAARWSEGVALIFLWIVL